MKRASNENYKEITTKYPLLNGNKMSIKDYEDHIERQMFLDKLDNITANHIKLYRS